MRDNVGRTIGVRTAGKFPVAMRPAISTSAGLDCRWPQSHLWTMLMDRPFHARGRRWYVARAGLLVAAGVLIWFLFRLSDPLLTPPDDFVAYWAAGRVNLAA